MTTTEFEVLGGLLDMGSRTNIIFYINDLIYESHNRGYKMGVKDGRDRAWQEVKTIMETGNRP